MSDTGERYEHLLEDLLATTLTFEELVVRRSAGSSDEVLALEDIAVKPDGRIDPFIISMEVRPSDSDLIFVQFVCRVSVAADCRLAGVEVVEQRGLDCATEASIQSKLSERLEYSDADLVGLFFYAIELADGYNEPHGICSLCREAHGPARDEILRLGCFHCFHADCFWDWFDWEQHRLLEKVAELREDHNDNQAFVAKAMADLDIEPVASEERVYILRCPNCRERAWPLPDRGKREVRKVAGEQWVGRGNGDRDVSLLDLDEDVREMVRRLQLRQAMGMEKQRTAGGLV
jgi:hypothetical protein